MEVRDGTREEMLRDHATIVPTSSKARKFKRIQKMEVSAPAEKNMEHGVPCKSAPTEG